MNWAQTAAIIVAIVAAVGVGAGGIYTSLNGIHAQVAAIQAEAAADRRAMQGAVDAFRSEMLRFAERQSYLEGRLSELGAVTD